MVNRTKRGVFSFLQERQLIPSFNKLEKNITWIWITTVILPCIFIILDMGYSDLVAINSLGDYKAPYTISIEDLYKTTTATTLHSTTTPHPNTAYTQHYHKLNPKDSLGIVIGLWFALCIIYAISVVFMLFSLSSLRTSYRTAVDLSDKDKEETGTEISLGISFNVIHILQLFHITGSLSRYDLSLEECTESSLQAMLQLTTYLTIQMRPPDVFSTYYVDSNFQYQAILVSCIFSTLSLTMGQVKVKINTIAQSACVHNTIDFRQTS